MTFLDARHLARIAYAMLIVAGIAPRAASQAGNRASSAPAAPASSPTPLVIGETFTIISNTLHETRRINVYLPPVYAESATARLPVLYMPDGGMAEDFLHVAGLVQVLNSNGTMRPFILVGIENTERRRDLTGPTTRADDKKIAPRVGGSAAFRSFIRSELMPAITQRYRTTNETAIVGESLAGLFVVETFFLDEDLFDTYIAFDPSLWWNGGSLVDDASHRLRAQAAAQKTENAPQTRQTQKTQKTRKTLYIASSSEKGITEFTEPFAAILAKDAPPNLVWHYERMPEETHATIYHPAALRAFRAVLEP